MHTYKVAIQYYISIKMFPEHGSGKHEGVLVRSTNFHEVACLPLTMNALGKSHFALDRVRDKLCDTFL